MYIVVVIGGIQFIQFCTKSDLKSIEIATNCTQQTLDIIDYTVCPGSSDPPEKIFNIFASQKEVYTIY